MFIPFLGPGEYNDHVGTHRLINHDVAWGVNQSGTTADFSELDVHFDCGQDVTVGLSAITIEAWVKTTGTSENILCNDSDDNALYFIMTGSGYFEMGINTAEGTDGAYSSAVNDGEWHHLVGVWKSGTRVALYVDGEVPSTTSYGANRTGTLIAGDDNLFIGGRPWAPLAADYNGELGYVTIYNRKLPFAEIIRRYKNPWEAWNANDQALLLAAVSPAGSTFSSWLINNNNVVI